MTDYQARLLHYATAQRATAGKISQLDGNKFVTYWAGRLHGVYVCTALGFKFTTKEAALSNARRFRQECRDEAIDSGLIKDPAATKGGGS